MAISIITITSRGIHLNASGFRYRVDIVKHLRERLEDNSNVQFIVIDTTVSGTTSVEQLNREQAHGVCGL